MAWNTVDEDQQSFHAVNAQRLATCLIASSFRSASTACLNAQTSCISCPNPDCNVLSRMQPLPRPGSTPCYFWLWNCLEFLPLSVLEPVKTIGIRNVHAITKSLTVMSRKRRDIKPLLQHNSGNNLIFVPWLQSIDTVFVDGSQESNVFLSSKERTTRQGSVCYMGSEFKYSYARNALKRSKEVSGLCHKLTCSLCSDSKGAKCSRMPDNFT